MLVFLLHLPSAKFPSIVITVISDFVISLVNVFIYLFPAGLLEAIEIAMPRIVKALHRTNDLEICCSAFLVIGELSKQRNFVISLVLAFIYLFFQQDL